MADGMEWPEMLKCNDLRSFELQLEDALRILEEKTTCYVTSLNRKKELQHFKDQFEESFEARTERIRRLELKKSPIKQQIERGQESISQIFDEMSKSYTEIEYLKFKNLSQGKEVEEVKKELRKRSEVHLKAMEYYKRKLQVRLEMNDNEKLTLYFTDIRGSVILSAAEDWVYKLIATEPELECFDRYAEMLEITQDVSGCIAHIRELLQIKTKATYQGS